VLNLPVVFSKSVPTDCRVFLADGVVQKRSRSNGCVVDAGGVE
jgi:hypothetical protein